MKPQKFSISDILTRSPKHSGPKTLDIRTHDAKESSIIPNLPTPPGSPDMDSHKKAGDQTNDVTVTNRYTVTPTKNIMEQPLKRKRDPIGQILDSLCQKSAKTDISDKTDSTRSIPTPSAFSPIITSSCSPQLSPLSMLAKCDRRCVETSPGLTSSFHATSPGHVTLTTAEQPRADHIQLLQAQKLAIYHHQQQQHQHQRQQQHQLSLHQQQHQHQIALQHRLMPYLLQQHGVHPANAQQVQLLQEQHAQAMAYGCYAPNILASRPLNLMHPSLCKNASPWWMAWLKSSADSTHAQTQLPLKEPRIPPPPRYQCDSCKKSYSTFGGLSKHKQFHCVSHVKKEFNCKYCDKSYGSLGALKMHIRTHTLPCKCKLCGKAFSRPWLLQGHVRTHTGEKPFKCMHCGRSFADRSNLRAHLQTHSDIKKYGCKNCTKTFSRMSLLLKHEDGSCVGLRR